MTRARFEQAPSAPRFLNERNKRSCGPSATDSVLCLNIAERSDLFFRKARNAHKRKKKQTTYDSGLIRTDRFCSNNSIHHPNKRSCGPFATESVLCFNIAEQSQLFCSQAMNAMCAQTNIEANDEWLRPDSNRHLLLKYLSHTNKRRRGPPATESVLCLTTTERS